MKASLYLYLFLMMIVGSFNVYAGADPDEVTVEEEIEIQGIVKQEVVKTENVTQSVVVEEVVVVVSSIIGVDEGVSPPHADIINENTAKKTKNFLFLFTYMSL